ncbi:hypothetical protein GTP81_09230 [Rugamonas sp. FT107W]|uniref:DUF1640 domain-containing protein n=1 Tax=Duganella vulcania TaxID=2692166 RepID=A0A845HH80_9BURK|nr:hypothetical protein [Duganella vulcania]MYN16935.1 hypothetical protein [Duganella vulcania]
MNGNDQPKQEQHHIIERIARLETAVDYQGQAISRLREEMCAAFSRMDTSMDAGFSGADTKMDAGFIRADARMDAGFNRADARMDAGFARVDAEFVRVHEQLMKIRTTDFRILLGICLSTALGTIGLIVKVFGLL